MKFEIGNTKKVALLVIDMENDFVEPGAPMQVQMAYNMVPNVQKLLETCREKKGQQLFILRMSMEKTEEIWV